MWTCRKRAAGGVKSPNRVTVWRETLERFQDWQGRAQVRQSFCTPGHTKRCETSFAAALVPECDKLWTDWTLGAVGDLERTVEISQQTCRSRWRPWCRGSLVSRPVER
jgi:hypothetical protein